MIHGAYQRDLFNRATLEGIKGLWAHKGPAGMVCTDHEIVLPSRWGYKYYFWIWEHNSLHVKSRVRGEFSNSVWTLCGSLPDLQQEPRWFKIRKHNSVRMVAQFTTEVKKCWVLRDARSQQRCSQAGFLINEGHQSEWVLIMLESMVTQICSECCKMIVNVSKLTISTIIT